MTIRRKDAEDDVTTWKIYPATAPLGIDITNKQGKLEKSIYKFEGDKLTICFADPGNDRPTKFGAPEGFKGGVLILRKGPANVD